MIEEVKETRSVGWEQHSQGECMKQGCGSTDKDMEGWEDHTETTKLNEYTKMRKGQGQRCYAR